MANDIYVENQGVQDIQLSFYNSAGELIDTTETLAVAYGTIPVQTFQLGTIEHVAKINLQVIDCWFSDPYRIEIREVAFDGVPEVVPEPSACALSLASLLVARKAAKLKKTLKA